MSLLLPVGKRRSIGDDSAPASLLRLLGLVLLDEDAFWRNPAGTDHNLQVTGVTPGWAGRSQRYGGACLAYRSCGDFGVTGRGAYIYVEEMLPSMPSGTAVDDQDVHLKKELFLQDAFFEVVFGVKE